MFHVFRKIEESMIIMKREIEGIKKTFERHLRYMKRMLYENQSQ